MINTQSVVEFFSKDVVGREGFILSADTCNPKHIGPKLMGFVRAFDPQDWETWLFKWGDYEWGTDDNADAEAYEFLLESIEDATLWAQFHVPGMVTETEVYSFAFSDYDGALLGWWRYPVEQ